MITFHDLTKRYGDVLAVDGLDAEVAPGRVTGFLGPNGAGKSTTMRMLLGLDRPTRGSALVDGRPVAGLTEPLRHVGALLDAGAVHPGRSGINHLRVAARSNGIPLGRVDAVIDQVGLGPAAGRPVKGYSLGMRQRLGIAGALLGDPAVLVFDEPMNGLDLDGVRWVRGLFRELADEGRTVLVSSHLMSEVQQTADHLLIIGRGRLLADAAVSEVLAGAGLGRVLVRTPEPGSLVDALRRRGATVTPADDGPDGAGGLHVTGLAPADIGNLALAAGVAVHGLTPLDVSLEEAYLGITEADVQYRSPAPIDLEVVA